ncbi:hypothetical protein HKX48_005239 [Thoreauomyces humboldtii]|nr:hypothetical protein HKX48_005239 [Thoreauomyces humboldtii]
MAVSGLQQVAYAAVVAPPASPRSSVDEERSRVLESTYARLTSVHETLRAAQRRMGSLQGFIEDVDDRVRDALVALDSVGGDDVGRETRLGRAIDLLEGLVGTIAEEVGQRPSHDTHDTS